jgi:hypothetical protein
MWPWRDWVIRAMNDNLPFDQFLTWQLAGDQIPNATQDQRLASAFKPQSPLQRGRRPYSPMRRASRTSWIAPRRRPPRSSA